MFETGSRSKIPFLQTETSEKEKNFPRGFFTSASLRELEKRPTRPEQTHGFVVSTCDIARRSAHDRTHFS